MSFAKLYVFVRADKYKISKNRYYFNPLDKDPLFLEQSAEIPRGVSPFGLENTIEVGQVIEAAAITYLRDVLGGVHTVPCGAAQTDVYYGVYQGAASL